jgi:hypothetical protein
VQGEAVAWSARSCGRAAEPVEGEDFRKASESMGSTALVATKARGRPFELGNPGKPKGARHRATRAVEALLEGEAEALMRRAIEAALGGDTTALKLCLDRVAPALRERPVSFALPPIACWSGRTRGPFCCHRRGGGG